MFKVYTLTDGMVGDLVATHNERDAYAYMNALVDDYEAPDVATEVTVVMVEDEPHIPADEVGPDARWVSEHTIAATAAAPW